MNHRLSDVGNPDWLKYLPLPQQYEPSLVSGTYGSGTYIDGTGTYIDKEVQNYRLLADTIGCALGADQYWYAGDGSIGPIGPGVPSDTAGLPLTRLFEGEGLMKPTQTWTNAALEWEQAKIDVHTCLVTRLNAFGRYVRIWLRGNDMATKPGAAGTGIQVTYPGGTASYEEALWLALPWPAAQGAYLEKCRQNADQAGATPAVCFYAWPLKNLKQSCGDQTTTEAALKWRVCGQVGKSLDYVNGCGVTVIPVNWDTCGKPGAEACPCVKSAPGIWTCTLDGVVSYPVIETRLSPQDWPKIYEPPPHHWPTTRQWCQAPPTGPSISHTTPKPAGP
jgi:hypothetical protein